MLTEAVEADTMPRNPRYESLSEGKIRLLAPWTAQLHGILFGAPTGFVCDGASIPRFFWRLIGHPLQEPIVRAAILHDAAYAGTLYGRALVYLPGDETVASDHLRPIWMPVAMADAMFRDLLKSLRVSGWRRWACFSGVRLYSVTAGRRAYVSAASWLRAIEGTPSIYTSASLMMHVDGAGLQ